MTTKTFITKLLFVFFVINCQVLSAPQMRTLVFPKVLKTPIYFSNIKQTIFLELTDVNECLNVKATLWRLTTRLGAEISQQSLIDCTNTEYDFTKKSVEINFQFTTPVVKQDSPFKWEFTSCDQQQNCTIIGDHAFTVLADDLLKPIRVWAKKHSLYVYDKSNSLQAFLDKNSIEYMGTKSLLRKNEVLISLIVISTKDTNIDIVIPANKSQAVILFHQYPSELALIIDKTNSTTPLLDVQMPLIDMLEKDAAAQKLFLKLFYMLPQTIVIN